MLQRANEKDGKVRTEREKGVVCRGWRETDTQTHRQTDKDRHRQGWGNSQQIEV